MQGINKAKHVHLLDALLQLESLLEQREFGDREINKAENYRSQLKAKFHDYEVLLNQLAQCIAEYEDLFSEVKVQYLGRMLKEMKKESKGEKPSFLLLVDHVRLAYGT